MLGNVLIFLRIPKLVNNLGSKAKSEENDQSILEGPAIFESEYTCCLLETDSSIWIDLTAFSVFSFAKTSISFRFKILYKIV